MYNTIIEKTKPYIDRMINEYPELLIFAFNLYNKNLAEEGVNEDSDKTQFIWNFLDKEDVEEGLSYMSVKSFYRMVKESQSSNFYFDDSANILTKEQIHKLLTDDYQYYMCEALSQPWLNEKTQRLYKLVWNIAVCGTYPSKIIN